MKYVVMIFVSLLALSCQTEEFSIEAELTDEEIVSALSPQLVSSIQSAVAHDGTFDDIVDESSCFSIQFPYVCFYDGEPYTINSDQDLEIFSENDILLPEFPITLILSDHSTQTVANNLEFASWKQQCEEGSLEIATSTCVDLLYPFSMGVYDVNSTDFETVTMESDKAVYLSFASQSAQTLFSMNYPMTVRVSFPQSSYVTVNSNEELQEVFDLAASNCQ